MTINNQITRQYLHLTFNRFTLLLRQITYYRRFVYVSVWEGGEKVVEGWGGGGGVCKLFYFLEFVRIRSKDFLPTLRMIRNNKYIKITYSIISKNPLLVKMGNFYIIVSQN